MALTPSATPSQSLQDPTPKQDQHHHHHHQSPSSPSSSFSSAPPALPPPQIFDILPALHELLARIDHSSANSTVDSSSTSGAAAAAAATTTTTTTATDTPIDAHYAELVPLDPKDLPNEVLAIKARIRRALRELEKLPDMHRGLGEQREELVGLEARVEAQRAMVGKLAEMARGMEG